MTLKKFYLSRWKMLSFLEKLEETTNPIATSFYFPPGMTAPTIEESFITTDSHPPPAEHTRIAASSENGAVLFCSEEQNSMILPPFPLKEKAVFTGFNYEPLRRLLESNFLIGLILLHLGTYAIGVCQGDKLITSKVGTGLVHGRHKKGGSSQQRFQRRRQNQVNEFLDRVCLHIREQLESYVKYLDYTVYGGPRQTVLQLKKRCSLLQSFRDRSLPLIEVPPLRQKVLEDAVAHVWSSFVIEW